MVFLAEGAIVAKNIINPRGRETEADIERGIRHLRTEGGWQNSAPSF